MVSFSWEGQKRFQKDTQRHRRISGVIERAITMKIIIEIAMAMAIIIARAIAIAMGIQITIAMTI